MMKKWKETFSILIIGLSFIGLILFIKPTIQNQPYSTEIPKTTISHCLINSYDLFKKIVFNELFIQKDEVITEKIKDLLSKKQNRKTIFSV